MYNKNSQGKGLRIKLVYICYAVSMFFGGFPLLAGLAINLFSRDGSNKVELSHFRYQISIFIKGLIWTLIGWATAPLIVGFVILFILFIWFLVRCYKGFKLAEANLPINEYYYIK